MSEHICLIVDDEEAIRAYLRAILEKEQMHCLEAKNATEALKIVERLGGRLDLIVTDIVMPEGDIDGIDLAHSIGNSYPAITTILISGYADEKTLRRAASVFRVIKKPFAVDTIVKAVQGALRGTKAAGGA